MATKVVLQGETAIAVWDDHWRPIYQAIGALSVRRATEVEFNNASGEWEAVHLESGYLIARGPNRAAVIDREVTWLENQWLEATATTKKENQACRTL